MVALSEINQYYIIVGSTLGIILTAFKIYDFLNRGPKLKIDLDSPQFYIQKGNNKISVEFGLELTNKRNIPIQFKEINFKILDKQKRLTENTSFENHVSDFLELHKSIKKNFSWETINKNYYESQLYLELTIISTKKTWKKIVKMLSIEEVKKLFENDSGKTHGEARVIRGKLESVRKIEIEPQY